MSLSRSQILLRTPRTLTLRTFTTSRPRLANQDYGSGAGDPKGEKPQEQGPNPSADKEHPGPPPPQAGQGTGGATKKGSEGHKTTATGGGSAQQFKGFHTFAASEQWYAQRRGYATKVEKPKGDTQNARPTLLDENPPAGDEQPDDVKKHNEEMSQRAEKASAQVSNEDAEKDKVKPGFWAGKAGDHGDGKNP